MARGVSARGSRTGILQFLDGDVAVRVDADVAGDLERALGDLARAELRGVDHGARGGERVRPARADGDDAAFGLDDVAGAGDEERLVRVGDDDERLELAQ